MDYQVDYASGRPHTIRFQPDFITGDGSYNVRLGKLALNVFCPDGWKWDGDYLSKRLAPNHSFAPEDTILEAQTNVTSVMDDLNDFQKLLKVIEEYKRA